MNDFFTILSPSYLLFPALVGTLIMGLVCPLIGSYLVLRRTIFLGLTLPEIAAAGVSFTFWLQQTGILPQFAEGERSIGMIGSLVFTFLGMGLLGYLEQRGKGLAEGRLAAAYAFAGALTILFMVFNPAGQIEVLNLLKGEVIALSRGELKLLTIVFGLVFLAMLVFRREFLLISFDRDLAFLLKGRQIIWDILLYLLAGLVIALGVIMAGPLLIFGFLVLPALAARPLVSRMSSFLLLASVFGLIMAFLGFYSSVRLDLPLGPTDVALGCCLIFLAYGLSRVTGKARAAFLALALCSFSLSACGAGVTSPPVPEAKAIHAEQLWLAKVKNSTALPLLLPSNNPLRSLAEMAGKMSCRLPPERDGSIAAKLCKRSSPKGVFRFPCRRTKTRALRLSPPTVITRFEWPGTESFPALFLSVKFCAGKASRKSLCAPWSISSLYGLTTARSSGQDGFNAPFLHRARPISARHRRMPSEKSCASCSRAEKGMPRRPFGLIASSASS